MGFDFLTSMHTVAMLVGYFWNALCLVVIHMLMKDKAYLHWRDQYTRESRIIATVNTVFSFKATRIMYSDFAKKPYFDATFDSRLRTLVRPFFIITMFSVLSTAIVFIADVYTIWLLRWGYELVTLAISSMTLAIAIFVLEIYEFILCKREEPEFLGVGDYFDKQVDPKIRQSALRKQEEKRSIRKSQVKVMSIIEDGSDAPGIPQSEDDYATVSQVNQS